MLITEILARNARMYGNETALVERDPAKNRRKEITWQEFDDHANKVARALMARGIKKGDRVVHLMTNCIDWLPIYFGILRTGAWAVPLNFRFVGKTIRLC
ncbi:MAG: AMP-binding protein, partial [Deltaproteobacteria bacterium]|nr:AMP-binding protein [Deltaproteobacteria bacterium]